MSADCCGHGYQRKLKYAKLPHAFYAILQVALSADVAELTPLIHKNRNIVSVVYAGADPKFLLRGSIYT